MSAAVSDWKQDGYDPAAPPHPTMRHLVRLWVAAQTAWHAFCRAWAVTGQLDGRLRRQRLRLAALDDRELIRLESLRCGSASDPYREELYRRGLLR